MSLQVRGTTEEGGGRPAEEQVEKAPWLVETIAAALLFLDMALQASSRGPTLGPRTELADERVAVAPCVWARTCLVVRVGGRPFGFQ